MKGNSAALALQEKQAGYAWFCTDDGSFHIDYLDSDGTLKRKQINDALFTRLAALQKIVNNLLLFNSLDAGKITAKEAMNQNEFTITNCSNSTRN